MDWKKIKEFGNQASKLIMGSDPSLPPIYSENADLLSLTLKGKKNSDYIYNGKTNFWSWDGADWYRLYPYQFVVGVANKSGEYKDKYYYTLPIPPQALVVKMIPASQVTATFGGVVEETSENTFWSIQLMGTTGVAVSRGEDDTQYKDMAKEFRRRLETTGMLSGVIASASTAAGKIGNVIDSLAKGFSNISSKNPAESAKSVVDGVWGSLQTAFLPPLPYSSSSVNRNSNGYTEAQELHRFLFTYSKLKSIQPSKFKLMFLNHKDRQRWDVVVKDFTLQKSAQNPMLYRYVIQLQGWGIRGIDSKLSKSLDRFGIDGDLKSVNMIEFPQMLKIVKDLGKDGSELNKVKNSVKKWISR